ncbi:MAG TPA: hypothetical protein PKU97_11895 [Kofleriaceae bacterium]|nr:hypothetical protein [Kofleriaceae bacterium]
MEQASQRRAGIASGLPRYLTALRAQILGREPWVLVQGSRSGEALSEPLRSACELVSAYAQILPWAGQQRGEFAAALTQGAEYLVAVQGADGVFPFPDLTDDAERLVTSCRQAGESEGACRARLPRPLQLAVQAKEKWEAAGRPPGVLVDGWFLTADDGGLQFDTGTCGVALVQAAGALAEPRYLQAARRAAQWASAQPVVANWNYNAFSVELQASLAATFERAGEPDEAARWRDAAQTRARLGVLPGALADGRWYDPHNARLTYHHILLRALARLALVVDDPWVSVTLDAAFDRSVAEINAEGAAAWADGIGALVAARQTGSATVARRSLTASATPCHGPSAARTAHTALATLPSSLAASASTSAGCCRAAALATSSGTGVPSAARRPGKGASGHTTPAEGARRSPPARAPQPASALSEAAASKSTDG